MQTPPGQNRVAPLWPLGLLIGIFALANLLMPAIPDQVGSLSAMMFAAAVLYGVLWAQTGLLTLWAVFGCHSLALRWLITLGAAEVLVGCFLAGIVLWANNAGPMAGEMVTFLLQVPLAFLVFQAPMWLCRAVTGWQIVPRGWQEASRQTRQFGIVDLITMTGIVAVALGLARAGLRIHQLMPEDALPFIFMYAVMAVFNGLLGVPCFWAVFAARRKPRAAVILLIYYALLGAATFALSMATSGGFFSAETLGLFVVFGLSFLAVLPGALGLLQAGGYVLLRPRRKVAGFGPDADGGASPFGAASPFEGTSPFAPVAHEE